MFWLQNNVLSSFLLLHTLCFDYFMPDTIESKLHLWDQIYPTLRSVRTYTVAQKRSSWQHNPLRTLVTAVTGANSSPTQKIKI
jgi:hypothetical protein